MKSLSYNRSILIWLLSLITLLSSSHSLQSLTMNRNTENVKPVKSFISDSSIALLRHIRSSPFDMIDRSFDAMKCTLKILSTEMSHYHSNRLMCCSLWEIKSYLKSSAEQRCDKPDQIKEVFDHFINEELIYSPISKSLLGNQNLSCSKYSEGSAACAGFMFFIKFLIIMILIALILLICGFIFFCNQFFKLRKRNRSLLEQMKFKGNSDCASTSSSIENNNSSDYHSIKKANYLRSKGDFNLPKNKQILHNLNVNSRANIAEIDIETKF